MVHAMMYLKQYASNASMTSSVITVITVLLFTGSFNL